MVGGGPGTPAPAPPPAPAPTPTPAPTPATRPAPAPTRTPPPPAASPESAVGRCDTTPGERLLAEVNRLRASAGVAPVEVDLRLVQAAAAHSADMARRGVLGHRGSDGREVHQRAEGQGYDWLRITENVASGQPGVPEVMGSWMNSPGHRRNILDPDVRHFGGALARASDGRTYWTQVFGNTDRAPSPAARGCHP